MSRCTLCGSYAINQHAHGRVRGKYTDLCDVCYWRADYASLEQECERLRGLLMEAKAALDPFDDKILEARINEALSAKP